MWLITFHPQKKKQKKTKKNNNKKKKTTTTTTTEVMLISNIFKNYNLELIFNTNVLKIVDAHKHLGVILSSNNKWTKHIIIGFPIFASLNSLYLETGWDKLDERRKSKKLALMDKIVNNEAPSYLNNQIR